MKFRFKLYEKILLEGTKYDKLAAKIISNSGLFDEKTSNEIIQSLFRTDIHAFSHTPWLEKYLKGIARMIVEESHGDMRAAENFLSECTSVYDAYLTWVKENRTEENKAKLEDDFINKMSYQDVKDFLDKMQSELDKESKEKLSQMKFERNNYSLVPIDSYDQMHKLYGGRATGDGSSDKYAGGGGSAWCHTNSKNVYDSWVSGGNKFFVLQNNNWKDIPFDRESNNENPKDVYGNSLIAILVDERGRLKKATLRCNHEGVRDGVPDNQYKTYAELSEIAGFNVEEEVGKYIDILQPQIVEIEESWVKSIDLLSIEEASSLPVDIRQYSDWWWLRSPGRKSDHAACVHSDGPVFDGGASVNLDGGAVRPALAIKNFGYLDLNLGDTIKVLGEDWAYIGSGKALLMSEPLARMYFNLGQSNIYEFSYIKHWLDNWFANKTGRKSTTKSPYIEVSLDYYDEVDQVDEDDVTGLNLLSIEEARSIPKEILAYSNWWWLRSPGWRSDRAALVHDGGSFVANAVINEIEAVRPALHIPNTKHLDIGNTIELFGYYWAYISNDKFLLANLPHNQPIANMAFNADGSKGNDYKTSDIKRELDFNFFEWTGKENENV